MAQALAVAMEAQGAGEPPFGAVLIADSGQLIASASDEVTRKRDLTLHAEVNVVRLACRKVGPDLSGATLYTTVEPCPMCFTAAWLAKVSRIVFGASMDSVFAATRGQQRELRVSAAKMNALSGDPLALIGGVLSERCLAAFLAGARADP